MAGVLVGGWEGGVDGVQTCGPYGAELKFRG